MVFFLKRVLWIWPQVRSFHDIWEISSLNLTPDTKLLSNGSWKGQKSDISLTFLQPDIYPRQQHVTSAFSAALYSAFVSWMARFSSHQPAAGKNQRYHLADPPPRHTEEVRMRCSGDGTGDAQQASASKIQRADCTRLHHAPLIRCLSLCRCIWHAFAQQLSSLQGAMGDKPQS